MKYDIYYAMGLFARLKATCLGHRKDINDYSEVSQRIYDLIDEYKEKGMSEEEIVDKMTREEMHMSKDLLRFIIKSRM